MGARMVPANGQTTKTKKILYMSFWLERLSILLLIYTFACNFCSRKGGRASIGYRASIGTYTVYIYIDLLIDLLDGSWKLIDKYLYQRQRLKNFTKF